jgi:PRC-barrel domain
MAVIGQAQQFLGLARADWLVLSRICPGGRLMSDDMSIDDDLPSTYLNELFRLFNKSSTETNIATNTMDRETASLIGSDKVEGTAVYGSDEQKIGSIRRVMIDKLSGKVTYAVTSFGSFLIGIGTTGHGIAKFTACATPIASPHGSATGACSSA